MQAVNGAGVVDFGHTLSIGSMATSTGTVLDWDQLTFDSGLQVPSTNPVPEPSSLALLTTGGLIGAMRYCRRRRSSREAFCMNNSRA